MANIESIGVAESEAVWPLSIEAGWNQNVADWRFMLGTGRGFGSRGGDGQWEASSLVLPLGDKLAWISMVLVTRARRRGGLGTGLLRRCIAEVQASGAVAGLDATEQGRPIYLPLGFHDLYKISRWHFDGVKEMPTTAAVRPMTAADLPAVLAYDRALSRMDRPELLTHLAARQPSLAFVADSAGFVLGREGRTAHSIGPVIADDEATGLALIAKAASSVPGPFIIDVPDAHAEIRKWLERQGAVSPRGYVRMTLGSAPGLDDPSHVFALAGPELG
ncbi:MAG TPA: GNAT family N-acetyltransferase [Reyranella sp.]